MEKPRKFIKDDPHLVGINTTYVGIYQSEGLEKERDIIIKKILKLSKKEKTVQKSNQLGWQSSRDFSKHKCVKAIMPFIKKCLTDYIRATMDMSKLESMDFSHMWANICPKHSYHMVHDHPGSDLSGTYYLQMPDPAPEIFFKNPHKYMRIHNIGPPQFAVAPRPGDCVIFDSGVQHGVDQNTSDVDRISISFNCQINIK